MLVRSELAPGLIEELGLESNHVYRRKLSMDEAIRMRSAFLPVQQVDD